MQIITEINDCTGCSACVNICPKKCIQMAANAEGFPYPVITDQNACIGCGLCKTICPVQKELQLPSHPLAYAAFCKDDELRAESSSGGVFSVVALDILAQCGVVFGAIYDETFRVVHACAENEDQLRCMRGAKYAQSDLKNTFSEVKTLLNQGRQVLFSGTPCQVAGLKSFLQKDYDNLLCVDFVCHGIPSPMAWQSYVNYRAQKDNHGQLPKSINLRNKSSGWSHYQYSNVFTYSDGNQRCIKNGDSLFMQMFVGDYFSRKSCANCHFKGYGRVSDLTIGDFWGIWDIAPEMDDNKGTSLVLVQSEKGHNFFKKISGSLIHRAVTLEQVSVQNPSLLKSSSEHAHRTKALSALQQDDWELCEKIVSRQTVSLPQKAKQLLRRIFR